jgi:hypothetical protein
VLQLILLDHQCVDADLRVLALHKVVRVEIAVALVVSLETNLRQSLNSNKRLLISDVLLVWYLEVAALASL